MGQLTFMKVQAIIIHYSHKRLKSATSVMTEGSVSHTLLGLSAICYPITLLLHSKNAFIQNDKYFLNLCDL